MAELDRIRWHCRRGLLELDLVLAGFVDRHLEGLNTQDMDYFEELLDYADNDLLDLVMGRAELCNLHHQPMLDLLRDIQVGTGPRHNA